MGHTVYDSREPVREGAHVYVHSAKEDPTKKCFLIINNSETESTTVDIPKDGTVYVLSGDPIAAGKMELAPLTCTFLVL